MIRSDLIKQVLEKARQHSWKLAAAESCSGGLVSAALTELPGSSDIFDRGFVTYSNAAKHDLLAVPLALIEEHGAVSQAVAISMADGAIKNSNADCAVSVTGIAGPDGGSTDKPVGMVWFGLSIKGVSTEAYVMQFGALSRSDIRQKSEETALNLFLKALDM